MFKWLCHFMFDYYYYYYFSVSFHYTNTLLCIDFIFIFDDFVILLSFFLLHRKIWSRIYGNPQIKDQYTALLGIPKASRLDEGVYTCQVSHQNVLVHNIVAFLFFSMR